MGICFKAASISAYSYGQQREAFISAETLWGTQDSTSSIFDGWDEVKMSPKNCVTVPVIAVWLVCHIPNESRNPMMVFFARLMLALE